MTKYSLFSVLDKMNIKEFTYLRLFNKFGREDADQIWEELSSWTFTINHAATTRLGQCRCREQDININHILVENEQFFDEYRDTMLHEIAHAVDWIFHVDMENYHRGWRGGHGKAWKSIMRAFGLKPTAATTVSGELEKMCMKELHDKRQRRDDVVYQCCDCERKFVYKRKWKDGMVDRRIHGSCRKEENGGRLFLREYKGQVFKNPAKVAF